ELKPSQGAAVADMGSGTGLFSAALLEKGYAVYGVEPDDTLRAMAARALARCPGFRSVAGAAERSSLPDASVDLIAAASAFHWFDRRAFRAECRRILKPGGIVLLVYNIRACKDEIDAQQAGICRAYCPKFTSLSHGAEYAQSVLPDFLSDCREKRFPNPLRYTAEQFLERCLSSSYALTPADARYPAFYQALSDTIYAHAGDGELEIGNETVVWYGRPG
nr:class I SAM-dependent methyltransferase [Clostridia bacterium]